MQTQLLGIIEGLLTTPSRHPSAVANDQQLSDFLRSVDKRAFKRAQYATQNADAALDVVQDSMIRLAEKYGDHDPAEWPMLFQRILTNAILDWHRRQKVRSAWMSNLSDFQAAMRNCRRTTGADASVKVPSLWEAAINRPAAENW